ncbi:hypothetical protein, partial [Enterococcus faecium]
TQRTGGSKLAFVDKHPQDFLSERVSIYPIFRSLIVDNGKKVFWKEDPKFAISSIVEERTSTGVSHF